MKTNSVSVRPAARSSVRPCPLNRRSRAALPPASLKKVACVVLVLVGGFCASPTFAQYTLLRGRVATGRASSGDGRFTMRGALREGTVARSSDAGLYSLTGSFAATRAVQSPGAPRLELFVTGTNTIIVAWPSESRGFEVQVSTTAGTTSWMAAPEPIGDDGARKYIIVAPSGGPRFYRLHAP